jgi:23S rRNA (cytosine1962-C5)-methyltransferase
VQRDHVSLIRECLRILSPGGVLYFSNNYTRFQLDHQAIERATIKDITRATTPFDFEGRLNRPCFRIEKNPG